MLGYVQDLGWDYIHANRDFYVARYGLTEFLGVPKYCFNKVRAHFSDALGALFIRDHLLTDDKQKVRRLQLYYFYDDDIQIYDHYVCVYAEYTE